MTGTTSAAPRGRTRTIIDAIQRRATALWGHQSMAPPVLLAAQLLVLYQLRLHHRGLGRPFLPFLDLLNMPVIVAVYPWVVNALFFGGSLLTLTNLAPRLGAAGAGSAIIVHILASQVRFSNNMLLAACLLVFMALQDRDDRQRWLLRGQLAVLYFGAAINKLLHPDWRDGTYFDFWTHKILDLQWYQQAESMLPAGSLSTSMGWSVIGVEFSLAALALMPRHLRLFVALTLSFHVGMIVFTGGVVSWWFLWVMLPALLALTNWSPLRTEWTAARLAELLPRRG